MVEETTTKTDADSVTEENTEAEVPEVGQPEEHVLDEENSPTNHQEEDNSSAPSGSLSSRPCT